MEDCVPNTVLSIRVFVPLVFPVTLWCCYYIHLEVSRTRMSLQGSDTEQKCADVFFIKESTKND